MNEKTRGLLETTANFEMTRLLLIVFAKSLDDTSYCKIYRIKFIPDVLVVQGAPHFLSDQLALVAQAFLCYQPIQVLPKIITESLVNPLKPNGRKW